MVLAYSIDKANPSPELSGLRTALTEGRARFLELADEDSRAYDRVRAARRAMKEQPSDPAASKRHREALRGAAEVPLETARRARDLAARFDGVRGQTRAALSSDLATALALYRAAVEGALANVEVNLADLKAAGELTAALEDEVARIRGAR